MRVDEAAPPSLVALGSVVVLSLDPSHPARAMNQDGGTQKGVTIPF
jgi:hypothetical protein